VLDDVPSSSASVDEMRHVRPNERAAARHSAGEVMYSEKTPHLLPQPGRERVPLRGGRSDRARHLVVERRRE
jgi:hypothetical protein